MKKLLLSAVLLTIGFSTVHAQIFISEIDPNGSGSSYGGDWFELTNPGATAVDITGWTMDDNSNSFGSSVALRGATSIAAGQSVVFIEDGATSTNDPTIEANFKTAWFGANVPAGFTIGAYGGSGVGLSGTADAVNIFNSSGTLVTRLDFGASSAGTFENFGALNNVTLTTKSVAGVNGAFNSNSGTEVGSPGAIPEPSTYALVLGGLMMLLFIQARRRTRA